MLYNCSHIDSLVSIDIAVTSVSNVVLVCILLRRVANPGTIVTNIADVVAIHILLVAIGLTWTVVVFVWNACREKKRTGKILLFSMIQLV